MSNLLILVHQKITNPSNMGEIVIKEFKKMTVGCLPLTWLKLLLF